MPRRCAFCRILLQKPRLAVLDEATSALDEATEAALYEALTYLRAQEACAGAGTAAAKDEWLGAVGGT